ncbi:hypothetical protein Ppa06_00470 [Planomonospora parontospora subsp. parontospora]|uniref:Uncharacterized protein n=2 Tax=Planomonospora parontospora TaxID=58119 RepID=A0AA37BAZ5_9ACTN|nr:hypothetical protein [Planomonospora parontospora]GGK44754.1 hypothetical protein GCM10010126_00470 [Planomonospora parontospora]GII06249.1 hypothetical protein Ppa06_00470 [Planomonospora parontospora subsp. parontospora]
MRYTRGFTYYLLNVAPDLVAPANVTATLGVERLAERGIEVRNEVVILAAELARA